MPKVPISAETVARVVALACGDPPGEATHWTGRAMAKATGISLRSVQRMSQSTSEHREERPPVLEDAI